MRRRRAAVLAAAATITATLLATGPASLAYPAVAAARSAGATGQYAPLDRPGPALDVPLGNLRASLQCSGALAHSPLEPVLLSPATGVTPEQNYSWNYENAFTTQGRPWC